MPQAKHMQPWWPHDPSNHHLKQKWQKSLKSWFWQTLISQCLTLCKALIFDTLGPVWPPETKIQWLRTWYPPIWKKNVHEQTASTTLQKPILKEIRLRPKKLDLSGASLKVSFYYQKLWFLLLRTQFGQRRLKIDQIIFGSHLEKPWLVSLNVTGWMVRRFSSGLWTSAVRYRHW